MTMAGKMTAAHRPLRRRISAVPSVPVLRLIEPWAGHYDEVHAVGSIREGLPAIRDVTSLPDSRSPLPMILASLLSRVANAGQPGPANHRRDRLGPVALLGLAAWCGTTAGLLEVVAVVARKRFLDTNHLLGMSRHFIWLVPLTDLLLLLLVGLVGSLVVTLRPEGGRRAVTRTLCALTLLPMLLGAFPKVYGLAWLLVALGASARLVPILERYGSTFRRIALYSSPILAGTLAILAALPWAADRIQQWRERERTIPPDVPNVLLIVMDTVAADHLALHGYDRPTSPAIDELARRGSRFDAALSASSWTLPSHASMFTGRWPHELSVGWRTPLDAASPTVAEFLRARGYATAGFIANTTYCASDSGLGRGYTVYRDYIFHELSPFKMAVMVQKSLDGLQTIGDVLGDAFELDWLRAGVRRVRERFETDRKEAAVVNREFLDWLAHRPQPQRPFFAFLNYCDAHTPYQLSPRRVHRFGVKPSDEREFRLIQDWWTMDKSRLSPQELAFVSNAYDDCVASIDEQIGRLFDELGRRKALDRTWVLLVSDHGESFGEHAGVFLHGSSLYQTELHVPLVVVPPPGTRIKPVVAETASLRDLAATIVDIAGSAADSPFPGASLARVWRPSSPSSSDAGTGEGALAELVPNETLDGGASVSSRLPWPLAALTQGGWSYIRREGEVLEELYHLREDPREQHNVADSARSRPRLERMREGLSRLTLGPLTPDRFNP
jgi:arylsulfatase A-like enzyme